MTIASGLNGENLLARIGKSTGDDDRRGDDGAAIE
jgi:hypothetical protein